MLPLRRGPFPTLNTERLQLVALEDRHFEAFAQLHSNPEIMRYIGDGKPLDRVGAWLQLATLLGHWDLRGYGVWAVEELGKEDLIGRVGLLHPEGWADPELNWMITPAMRGQGLAVEAARAVLGFAFDELGLARLISLVRPENTASSRVATKLGGTLAETITFMDAPMHVFRYERMK
jgi:[ribosomal protein S5]-alanine N-acetyltransferase